MNPEHAQTGLYVGSDIGGTFTDTVVLTESGELHTAKTPTTKQDLTVGAIRGAALAAGGLGLDPGAVGDRIAYYAHGTTQATNAFIERKGARTALLTTRGFRDVRRCQRSMDVRLGAVTAATALGAYGVVVHAAGRVDAEATARRRAAIIEDRRGWPVEEAFAPSAAGEGRFVHPVGDQLSIRAYDGGLAWTCRGHTIAAAGGNVKRYLGSRAVEPAEIGSRVRLHPGIEIRQYACGHCGMVHFTEVARHGDAPLFDIEVAAPSSIPSPEERT